MDSLNLDHCSPENHGSMGEFMLIDAVEAIHNLVDQKSENKTRAIGGFTSSRTYHL